MIMAFYVVATVINFAANSVIWIVVLKNNFLRSPMNFLLLNLSLADMISGLSVYPYVFILDVGSIVHRPEQQARLCIVTEGLSFFFVAAGASVFTLCAISGNRFLSTCYPTRQNMRMGRTSVTVFSIITWIFSTSSMLPGMMSFKYEPKFKSCIRDWGPINGFVYRSCLLFIGNLIPLAFLFVSFLAIVVKSRELALIDNSRINGRRVLQLRKAERMLGILIIVFIACWFPFSTFWSLMNIKYFPRTVQGVTEGNRWMRTTVFFATLNGTLNPFIYCLGSPELKRAVKQSLRYFWSRITCQTDVCVLSKRLSQRRIHPIFPVELEGASKVSPSRGPTLEQGVTTSSLKNTNY